MSSTTAASFTKRFFSKRKPVDYIKDILGGIIVALVSIPISMGYAQIAGLPMQYGLYGSVIPIFLFGLLTSSKDFVFGVDAAPAALVGTAIASFGITSGSDEAANIVPLMALLVSCWLLLFYLIKAGRIVQYISESVMGGFVSGICCTIILMQIPKLYGGTSGIGEAPELIGHMISQLSDFNIYSFILGISMIIIITLCRHLIPKVPMSVIMIVVGVLVTLIFNISEYGVKLLPEVESGFPGIKLSEVQFDADIFSDMLFSSLSIAAVILSESLLASKSNAMKDGYKLDPNREILSYSLANLASALSGCCPVNGSVSRTGIVRQFGAGSQWLSVSAALTMLGVLYLGTQFIGMLPVPILTAIVISALMGACEFKMAIHLLKTSKQEFYIFLAAFLGVLVFGTVYGVIIGIVLSFTAVVIKAVTPPRALMGIIPGKDGFYSLGRNSEALPIKNTVIYRFGGNLFFANINTLENDLEQAIDENTKQVIINASAVGSIDTAAAEHLLMLYNSLKEKSIKLYITEHIGEVNDKLRRYGTDELIENGAVRMTVPLALRAAGVKKPYQTEHPDDKSKNSADISARKKSGTYVLRSARGIQAEIEWAFGDDAESFKKHLTENVYQAIKSQEVLNADTIKKLESLNRWGRLNLFDEDELLDRLETRLLNRAVRHPDEAEKIEIVIEERRKLIEQKMLRMDPEIFKRLKNKRIERARQLYSADPETYRLVHQQGKKHLDVLSKSNPKLAEKYREMFKDMPMFQEKNSDDQHN